MGGRSIALVLAVLAADDDGEYYANLHNCRIQPLDVPAVFTLRRRSLPRHRERRVPPMSRAHPLTLIAFNALDVNAHQRVSHYVGRPPWLIEKRACEEVRDLVGQFWLSL
jgi:hypothetical protein